MLYINELSLLPEINEAAYHTAINDQNTRVNSMKTNYIALTMIVEGMSITASAAASTMHVEIEYFCMSFGPL